MGFLEEMDFTELEELEQNIISRKEDFEMAFNNASQPMKNVLSSIWQNLSKYSELGAKYKSYLEQLELKLEEAEIKLEYAMNELNEKTNIVMEQEKAIKEKAEAIDSSHWREEDSNEIICYLRDHIKELEKVIEDMEVPNQKEGVPMAKRASSIVDKEIDATNLNMELQNSKQEIEDLIQNINRMTFESKLKDEKTNEIVEDSKKALKMRKMLYKQIEQMTKTLNALEMESKNMKLAWAMEYKDSNEKGKIIATLKDTMEKFAEEFAMMDSTLNQEMEETSVLRKEHAELTIANTSLNKNLKNIEAGLKKLTTENLFLIRTKENNWKKFVLIERSRQQAVEQMKEMKRELERCVIHLKEKEKEVDFSKKKIESMVKEKRIQHEKLQRMSEKADRAMGKLGFEVRMTKLADKRNEHLHKCISRLNDILEEKVKAEERTKNYCSRLLQIIEQQTHENAKKESDLANSKKKNTELTQKNKAFQGIFDGLKSEKSNLMKLLQQRKEEHILTKNKLKLISTQLELLKEEVTNKENELAQAIISLKKKDGELEAMVVELKRKNKSLNSSQRKIQKLAEEVDFFKKFMKDVDDEKMAKDIEIKKVIYESGMVASQMDRKTTELSIVCKNIKVLNSVLKQGDSRYRERLEDIRFLKLDINNLRFEKNYLGKALQIIPELKKEIYRLNRDLANTRLENRVLEDQFNSPINYHRWRIIEGIDPEKKDMIDNNIILQKRLTALRKELAVKDNQFENLKTLYNYMKETLERLPGPEVAAALESYKSKVRSRDSKMKALVAEMSVSEEESKLQYINAKVAKNEMIIWKKKYFEVKMKLEKEEMNRKEQVRKGKVIPPVFQYRMVMGHPRLVEVVD